MLNNKVENQGSFYENNYDTVVHLDKKALFYMGQWHDNYIVQKGY